MNLNRTLTSTVYIVKEKKILLHLHKKFKSLFPVGGHIFPDELPHETAIREAYEESGLQITLFNSETDLGMSRVKQLVNPQYILLENIGNEVENIDFIYFATTQSEILKPQESESDQFFWLSKEEIEQHENIKEHIRIMAIKALDRINNV